MLSLDSSSPCADDEFVCNTAMDWTDNEHVAEVADVVIGTPLAIAGILLVGLIARFVLHRLVDRLVRKAEVGVLPDRVEPDGDGRGHGPRGDTTRRDPVVATRRVQRAQTMGSLLKSIITGIVAAIVVTMVLAEVDVNIAPIIASAGILGLALGFGAQSLVSDFLSGLFMIFEDQYGVGDVVDLGEATGTVEAVSLRVTRLRDVNGTVWYVRNGEIIRVGNMSQNWARSVLDINVAYHEDLVKVRRVLQEVAHDLWEDEDYQRPDHRGARGVGRRGADPRRRDRPGDPQDRAHGAVGGGPRDARAGQGPVRLRGHRDPAPPARRVAPRRERPRRRAEAAPPPSDPEITLTRR